MSAKIRIKCAHCGEANNVHSVNEPCPKCKQPLGITEEGSIYIYRQGSAYGIAGAFGLYINQQPYGHIGNKESLIFPLPYGTYNLHIAVGMSRKCNDLLFTLTPETPRMYAKTYIKPGFWSNSFGIEVATPDEMPND